MRRLVQEIYKIPCEESIKCPFCGNNYSAGFFTRYGAEFFGCGSPDCPTENDTLDEVGFVMAELNSKDRNSAFAVYLRFAEAEVDLRKDGCTRTIPISEQELEKAETIVRALKRASTELLKQRMKIGHRKAAYIIDILEQRGVVGPTRFAQGREVLQTPSEAQPPQPPQ